MNILTINYKGCFYDITASKIKKSVASVS